MPKRLVLAVSLLGAALPAFAASDTQQIAINATGTFFSVYRDSGMGGAVAKIKGCYDTAKSRDAYLFCVAMDTQAMRMDYSVSSKLGNPPMDYFAQAEFDDRIAKLQTWYPSKSQLDYTMNQLMDGMETGLKAEVARIEQK
ncbi:MAG: hypothetical protein ACO24O_04990 [Arenimonas sp.]